MSKYTGKVIVSAEGQGVICERELTVDEVIDELLQVRAVKPDPLAELIVDPIPQVSRRGRKPGKVADKPQKAKKEKVKRQGGVRNCKKCGQPGHMAKTCTNDAAVPDPAIVVGYNFKKHTPAPAPSGKDVLKEEKEWQAFKPRLSQAQFNDARRLKSEDLTAEEAASEMNVPIESINFAYQSMTYDTYMRLERRG